MLKIVFILFITLSLSATSQTKESKSIQWVPMQEALDIKPKNKKLIFVDVYTTWCGWCKRMDQTTFQDPQVIETLNKYFMPVKFNAEGSETITHQAKTYNNPNPGRTRSTHTFTFVLLGERFGYPSFSILDESNNVIGIIQGYQTTEKLMSVLTFFKNKAYLETTYEEWLKKQ